MPCTDLTPMLQAKCAKSWERYNRIYSEVGASFRIDWESDFSGSPDYPYLPNSLAIHYETQRRVELEQRHEAEDRPEYVASGLY